MPGKTRGKCPGTRSFKQGEQRNERNLLRTSHPSTETTLNFQEALYVSALQESQFIIIVMTPVR